MALLSGTISYRKFRVIDELPRNFKETLVQNLPRHAFREIDPKTNPEFSIGWINPFEPMDTRLTLEKALFGKFLLLGVRRDRKNVAAALLRAQVSEAVRAQLRERKGRKLSREDMNSLRETVREKMLAAVSPSTSLYEMVWNYESQEVYFSAQAGKAVVEFVELFEETFGLALEETNLATRTERFIENKGLSLELVDIEPSRFA